jgi:ankyrin repeat protein
VANSSPANGHVHVINALVEKGITYLCEDELRRAPFSMAVKNSQSAVVEQLLNIGADPNAPDPSGCAPLSWAFASSNEAIIRILLLKGADPNTVITEIAPDEGGGHCPTFMCPAEADSYPPLFWAARRGLDGVVGLLLQMGADPNFSIESTRRNLHYIQRVRSLSMTVESRSPSTVRTLLDHGIRNDLCHMGLLLAMKLDALHLVTLIVQRGIQGKPLIEPFAVPLVFYAARVGYVDVVRGFLDKGLNVNIRWKVGMSHSGLTSFISYPESDTLLGLAMRADDSEVVDLLLQHGAEMSLQDGPVLL